MAASRSATDLDWFIFALADRLAGWLAGWLTAVLAVIGVASRSLSVVGGAESLSLSVRVCVASHLEALNDSRLALD